jgi:hypothetical protein
MDKQQRLKQAADALAVSYFRDVVMAADVVVGDRLVNPYNSYSDKWVVTSITPASFNTDRGVAIACEESRTGERRTFCYILSEPVDIRKEI